LGSITWPTTTPSAADQWSLQRFKIVSSCRGYFSMNEILQFLRRPTESSRSVLLGLWTRLVSIPLLIVIATAIATTKVPELFRANQGLWYMVSDARTDFAM